MVNSDMPLILGGPRSRLYLAVFALLSSVACLLFLFQDSVPTIERLSTSKTSIEHFDSAPNSYPYGALVVAAQPTMDLAWLNLLRQNWMTYEYDVERPDNPDPHLRFPKSRGHEAMVYLSFIIDNYDDLPWCAIFIHGHRNDAWHQEDDMVQILSGLNRTALSREGYISLRCDWYPSCPAEMRPIHQDAVVWGPEAERKSTEAAIAGNWRFLFPDEDLPETLASPCCAQFAVTRQAILKRPKTDYERLRDWLLGTLLEDSVSGRVLEKLWAYIFLGKAVHCPPPQQCACDYFGRCDGRNWTHPPSGMAFIPEWP